MGTGNNKKDMLEWGLATNVQSNSVLGKIRFESKKRSLGGKQIAILQGGSQPDKGTVRPRKNEISSETHWKEGRKPIRTEMEGNVSC